MKSLLKKLCAIQSEIESIEKSGYNDFQKYKYVKESDVLDAVRPLLVKHNVVLTMNTVEITNIVDMTQTKIAYTWYCVDTGENLTTHGYSQGCDKLDKGIYKAYTGGLKYFLMKSFLISSEDDPENEKQSNDQVIQKPLPSQGSPHAVICPSGKNRGLPITQIHTSDLENDLNYWNGRAAKGEAISGKLSIYLKDVEKELAKRKSSTPKHLDDVPPMEDLPF
jgi:hypothetical protein